jgi:hypothetical protein
MKTLFDPTIKAEILERIEKLNSSSSPKWGKMNVRQMLAHLDLSLRVNFDEIELKKGLLGLFFSGITRRMLLGEKQYPKYLPAHKNVIAKEVSDFSTEKLNVKSSIQKYVSNGPNGISKKPHYILGKITHEESALLTYKHIDHHLRQFGV